MVKIVNIMDFSQFNNFFGSKVMSEVLQDSSKQLQKLNLDFFQKSYENMQNFCIQQNKNSPNSYVAQKNFVTKAMEYNLDYFKSFSNISTENMKKVVDSIAKQNDPSVAK